MYIGIYINGNLYSRSNDFESAEMKAIKYLNERWEENKNDALATKENYLRSIKALASGEDTTFMGTDISFREVDEKKYAITYTITYDECEETIEVKYLSKQIKYVCYENNAYSVFKALKVDAEDNIGGVYFNKKLENGEVECLTDTESEYELYIPYKHQLHIVEIKEIV